MDYSARTSPTAESLPTAESFPTNFSHRNSGGARAEDALPTTIPEVEVDDAFSQTLMKRPMEAPHPTNNNNKKFRTVGQLTMASALSPDDVFLGVDGRLMQASIFLPHGQVDNNRALALCAKIEEVLDTRPTPKRQRQNASQMPNPGGAQHTPDDVFLQHNPDDVFLPRPLTLAEKVTEVVDHCAARQRQLEHLMGRKN
jgi:hypothetical protein